VRYVVQPLLLLPSAFHLRPKQAPIAHYAELRPRLVEADQQGKCGRELERAEAALSCFGSGAVEQLNGSCNQDFGSNRHYCRQYDRALARPATQNQVGLMTSKPIGICRIESGLVIQDSAWVRQNGERFEVSRKHYESQGYDPPYDSLPRGLVDGPTHRKPRGTEVPTAKFGLRRKQRATLWRVRCFLPLPRALGRE
jgi:hypothetical protein